MDGNAGYNQIMVAEEDIHKTAFMCPGNIGAFEYTVMPFSLRNARDTYERAMNFVFHDMIGHSLEVYIDDVVIKSPEEGNHISNLRKAFLRMRQHKLKMNPKKCVFGVQAGNFLGFLEQNFKWEEQHQQAFEEIKHYLSNPPVLAPPKRGRPLELYVSASEVSIRSLLVQDNKEGKEQAVYYLSRTLTEVERKYSPIERLRLALYFTAKAVKGQAVVDFLADHLGEEIENMDSLDIANADLLTRAHTCLNNPIYSVHLTPWKLYFDGSKTDITSGAGIVLEEPLGIRHCYSF
ncbi:unnamed protein product [Prunus armeniaca]